MDTVQVDSEVNVEQAAALIKPVKRGLSKRSNEAHEAPLYGPLAVKRAS